MKGLIAPLIAAASILILAPTASAAMHVTWHRSVGATQRAVAVGSDGSIYVAGHRPLGPWYQAGPATLTKLTPNGAVVWSRSWRPHPDHPRVYEAVALAVDIAPNGTIYIAGTVQRYNCEGGGWFIRAYGPAGRLLHAFGTTQSWACRGRVGPQAITDLAVNGNRAVVAGTFYGCCGLEDFRDGWVRAFDGNLKPMWKAPFEPPAPIPSDWGDDATGVSVSALGNVFVSGWAATGPAKEGVTPPVGTLILEKVSSGGTVVWSHRPGVALGRSAYPGAPRTAQVSVSARSDRVMVTAAMRTPGGWLGRFDVGGVLMWSRRWGTQPEMDAEPAQVSVDASLRTWVVGTQKDPSDHGLVPFLRRYGPTGALLGKTRLDEGIRWLHGYGVAAARVGAVAVGTATDRDGGSLQGGHVWRIAA